MYKPSYELIGIKERKEGRLELVLFLLLDESFTFSDTKKYRLPQTFGAAWIYFNHFYFRFLHQTLFIFARKRNNHNINDSGSLLSYLVSSYLQDLIFSVDIIDTPSPPGHFLAFLRWREKSMTK